jgi:hypothetical protein
MTKLVCAVYIGVYSVLLCTACAVLARHAMLLPGKQHPGNVAAAAAKQPDMLRLSANCFVRVLALQGTLDSVWRAAASNARW